MSRFKPWAALWVTLLLSGCDDGSLARKAMAECKLPARAGDEGDWDDDYLRNCMQSKGYVEDDSLPAPDKLKCGDYSIDKLERAECYRDDGDLGKWRSQFRKPPAD